MNVSPESHARRSVPVPYRKPSRLVLDYTKAIARLSILPSRAGELIIITIPHLAPEWPFTFRLRFILTVLDSTPFPPSRTVLQYLSKVSFFCLVPQSSSPCARPVVCVRPDLPEPTTHPQTTNHKPAPPPPPLSLTRQNLQPSRPLSSFPSLPTTLLRIPPSRWCTFSSPSSFPSRVAVASELDSRDLFNPPLFAPDTGASGPGDNITSFSALLNLEPRNLPLLLPPHLSRPHMPGAHCAPSPHVPSIPFQGG